MVLLTLGLLLFLGIHSSRLLANDWRAARIARLGEKKWKLLYAAVSLLGLILIIIGYSQARMDPVWLWYPSVWARHLALLLTIPAFVLLAATYVPRNAIKARLGHPMLAAVKIWALSHLLANGTVADLLLFGGFLVWAIAAFAVFRRRDRAMGVVAAPSSWKGTLGAVVIGVIAWYVFAVYLHARLIGVNPLP